MLYLSAVRTGIVINFILKWAIKWELIDLHNGARYIWGDFAANLKEVPTLQRNMKSTGKKIC